MAESMRSFRSVRRRNFRSGVKEHPWAPGIFSRAPLLKRPELIVSGLSSLLRRPTKCPLAFLPVNPEQLLCCRAWRSERHLESISRQFDICHPFLSAASVTSDPSCRQINGCSRRDGAHHQLSAVSTDGRPQEALWNGFSSSAKSKFPIVFHKSDQKLSDPQRKRVTFRVFDYEATFERAIIARDADCGELAMRVSETDRIEPRTEEAQTKTTCRRKSLLF